MRDIPRTSLFDSTSAMMKDPYRFVSRVCRDYDTNVLRTRLMLRSTILMTGQEAARVFYDGSLFKREGAAPAWLKKTLFGEHGVQVQDDEEHRLRKAMFMEILTPSSVRELTEIFDNQLTSAAVDWTRRGRIELYSALHPILTRAVCRWAGVEVPQEELPVRAAQLTALFDKAGRRLPEHLSARFARQSAEQWLSGLVGKVRALPRARTPARQPLTTIAFFRGAKGRRLSPRTAAVELLNLLRPTVAVSVYCTFAALALHTYPQERQKCEDEGSAYTGYFIEEVRRFYPFFPSIMARVRHDFEWEGYYFRRGWAALLDLYGTNHDRASWDEPSAFNPERFRGKQKSLFAFIPQGGGDYWTGHRCAGEQLTIQLMRTFLEFLLHRVSYRVPPQDLNVDFQRLPALPESKLLLEDVSLRSAFHDPGPVTSRQASQCPFEHGSASR